MIDSQRLLNMTVFIRYTHKEEGGDVVTSMYGDSLKIFYNYFLISTNPDITSEQRLFYVDNDTITYKGQSLLVDTNNFITNGENVDKSVTFKDSNTYVNIGPNILDISRNKGGGSSIFKIVRATGDTTACNMNITNFICNAQNSIFIRSNKALSVYCGIGFTLIADTNGVNLSTANELVMSGKFRFGFNMNNDTDSIRFSQPQIDGNYNKKNFGFVRSNENNGEIYMFYSEKDSSKYQFGIRNFDEVNFVLTSTTNAYDLIVTSYTWSFKSDNLYHNGTPYVSKSFTVTHISPIDENYTYNDFTIGSPVYMSGKVYVKDYENKTWKPSTRNNTIDCISSIKPTGVLKEYLGICVSKETDEIVFASHGDFLVKVGDSSKYEIGDIIYINDNMDISILDENTPLTAKINKSIVGTVTSIIDSEFVAVFRD